VGGKAARWALLCARIIQLPQKSENLEADHREEVANWAEWWLNGCAWL